MTHEMCNQGDFSQKTAKNADCTFFQTDHKASRNTRGDVSGDPRVNLKSGNTFLLSSEVDG